MKAPGATRITGSEMREGDGRPSALACIFKPETTTMSAPENLPILPLPELFRDEVFRIETPRLWLRWPAAGDADRLEEIAMLEAAARGAGAAPHPLLAGKVADRIAAARTVNESGRGLALALVRKGCDSAAGSRPVGLITADPARGAALSLCFLLDVRVQGRGLMTEAVRGLVDAAFAFGPHRLIRGPSALANHAGRRVLEKAGFAAPAEVAAGARLELARGSWRGIRRAGTAARIAPPGLVAVMEMCSARAA
jgi:RimJ/RimL family protein N-acetyltransferase